jgi:hypothetical protein
MIGMRQAGFEKIICDVPDTISIRGKDFAMASPYASLDRGRPYILSPCGLSPPYNSSNMASRNISASLQPVPI